MSIRQRIEDNKRFDALEQAVRELQAQVQELRERAEAERDRVQAIVKRGPGRPPKVVQQ